MWQRFTEQARKVVIAAQEEAEADGAAEVQSYHLLLGVTKEADSKAVEILEKFGVSPRRVRDEIRKYLPPQQPAPRYQQATSGRERGNEKKFSDQAKKVLQMAYNEARQLNHNYVGTEHLLLGLLTDSEDVAARVLRAFDIDIDEVRGKVAEIGGPGAGAEEPAATGARGESGSQPSPGKKKSETPSLDEFGRDLTDMARHGQLDPVVGRELEIQRVIQILSRRTKNNPCLIGEPGVGKTAIAEGLAQLIISGTVPEPLLDKRIIALDLAAIVAGTKYRGEFEERMKRIMDEIRKARGTVILFIDELHTLIGAGGAEGAMDASNILKPALARGELQCIGATTLDEFKKYIERHGALERRFQSVQVREPTPEEAIEILLGLRHCYEEHHNVVIDDDAIHAAVELSGRYISERCLPDKAIDVIDEAGSRVRLRTSAPSPELKAIEEKLEGVRAQKEEAVWNQRFEEAARFRDEERKLKEELELTKQMWRERQEGEKRHVTVEDVASIVSIWTGVPVTDLTEEETARLLRMEEALHERVVGQHEAIVGVSKAVRRARAGIKDPRRPTASFIFLGPTGVGKTELARALAQFLFDSEEALIRIDMSEYMERFAVSRLIGSPPGYVGYDEGGQLTDQVRRRPFSVVLFDEIEKAHPDVFNILLQVMEDGRLTDSQGRTVDFRNTIIIMTSNVGAREIQRGKAVGFRADDTRGRDSESDYSSMKSRVLDELNRTFRPEFLNRVDEVIVFRSLTDVEIREIVNLLLDRLREQLKGRELALTVSNPAMDLLAKDGFDPNFGARPLRRAIQHLIEDPLSEEILAGRFRNGDTVEVEIDPLDPEGKRLRFEEAARPPSGEATPEATV
ncbi:MAG: ATP-dependent Clp protease ATP-binding subunit [Fimbriimonadaceae bacterium]|nr:ATP-dependent Clp protease ATP-binding subunit [Fimbriimonadaceae bacterium]